VITDAELSENTFRLLHELHEKFALGDSCWAKKIEAAYIARKELGAYKKTKTLYPQIEKGKKLTKDNLEMGWSFQCYTLREYGISIEGPHPYNLLAPVNENYMLQSAKLIVNLWKKQAHDEREYSWLMQRDEQVFVIATLCRFLHFICERKISSKQRSAQWPIKNIEKKWHRLIKEALCNRKQISITPDKEIRGTIAFIDYVTLVFNN